MITGRQHYWRCTRTRSRGFMDLGYTETGHLLEGMVRHKRRTYDWCTWIGKQAACVSYMSIWEGIQKKRKAILKQVTLNGHRSRCSSTLKCVDLGEALGKRDQWKAVAAPTQLFSFSMACRPFYTDINASKNLLSPAILCCVYTECLRHLSNISFLQGTWYTGSYVHGEKFGRWACVF